MAEAQMEEITQADIDRHMAELKVEDPAMFSHPDLKKGGICVGNFLVDLVYHRVDELREAGMRSARVGKTPRKDKITVHIGSGPAQDVDVSFHGVLVSQREFVTMERAWAAADKNKATAESEV